MIAITPRQRFPYVPQSDKQLLPAQQTTFFLRSLTLEERADLEDQSSGYDPGSSEVRMRIGSVALLAVRAGLVGCENLNAEGGNNVPFVTETKQRAVLGGHKINPPTDEFLERVDPEVIRELADEIRQRARLSNGDAKNS